LLFVALPQLRLEKPALSQRFSHPNVPCKAKGEPQKIFNVMLRCEPGI
jgi:hypothetical protein